MSPLHHTLVYADECGFKISWDGASHQKDQVIRGLKLSSLPTDLHGGEEGLEMELYKNS